MSVIICPGVHDHELTTHFVEGLSFLADPVIFPTEDYPAYSTYHILQFLRTQLGHSWHTDPQLRQLPLPPLLFIGFSAGVVGAIGAAWGCQMMGHSVKALIAVDGWGVPLYGNFPIHRLSHDAFTHWTSTLLEAPTDHFYADPPVPHLELWRSPQNTPGWRLQTPVNHAARLFTPPRCTSTTAADYLLTLLIHYGEICP